MTKYDAWQPARLDHPGVKIRGDSGERFLRKNLSPARKQFLEVNGQNGREITSTTGGAKQKQKKNAAR